MTAGLGLRIGSVTAVAALDDGTVLDGSSLPSIVRRSAIDVGRGHAPSLLSAAERPGPHDLTGFADRVGDPVPLIDEDGREHTGEDLFAVASRCLVDELGGGNRPAVVVAHPARWPRYTIEILEAALERAGIPDATLVPDSLASMRWLESTRGDQGTGLTIVYDLGASALDVTLVRSGAGGGIVGTPLHSEDIGGAQFDHLTLQHVLETISGSDTFDFDPFDPDTVGALVELRARCAEAKEALSSDTATALRIQLPGIDKDVRLVRSEFEDFVREPLTESIEYVREAMRTAGVMASDVTQVLLTGGSSAIPLVAELISAEFRVPVIAGPYPGSTAALGAASFAYDIVNAETYDTAAPFTDEPAAVLPREQTTAVPFVSSSGASTDKVAMSGRKKAGIVLATVVGLAVLAGGGLGVGTALTSNDTPPQSSIQTTSGPPTTTPASSAVAGATSAPSPTSVNGAAAGAAASAGPAAAGAASPGVGSAPAAGGSAPSAGSAPAASAPAAGAPAAGAPAAPVAQPPASQAPVNQPAPPANSPPAFQLPSISNPIPGLIGSNPLGDALNAAPNLLDQFPK